MDLFPQSMPISIMGLTKLVYPQRYLVIRLRQGRSGLIFSVLTFMLLSEDIFSFHWYRRLTTWSFFTLTTLPLGAARTGHYSHCHRMIPILGLQGSCHTGEDTEDMVWEGYAVG